MKNCLFTDKCKNNNDCENCEIAMIQSEVLRLSNIPKKYRGKRLAESLPPTLSEDAKKKLLVYADNFDKMKENGINMLIYPQPSKDNLEGCGTGKTTIACALGQEYIKQHLKEFNLSPLTLFINAEEFADLKRRESTHEPLDEMETYILNNVEKAPFLIIDDLGAEKISDFTLQSLYGLINTRLNNFMITIYTTNLTPQALQVALGERLYSRIVSSLRIETSGQDLRQQFINNLFS